MPRVEEKYSLENGVLLVEARATLPNVTSWEHWLTSHMNSCTSALSSFFWKSLSLSTLLNRLTRSWVLYRFQEKSIYLMGLQTSARAHVAICSEVYPQKVRRCTLTALAACWATGRSCYGFDRSGRSCQESSRSQDAAGFLGIAPMAQSAAWRSYPSCLRSREAAPALASGSRTTAGFSGSSTIILGHVLFNRGGDTFQTLEGNSFAEPNSRYFDPCQFKITNIYMH